MPRNLPDLVQARCLERSSRQQEGVEMIERCSAKLQIHRSCHSLLKELARCARIRHTRRLGGRGTLLRLLTILAVVLVSRMDAAAQVAFGDPVNASCQSGVAESARTAVAANADGTKVIAMRATGGRFWLGLRDPLTSSCQWDWRLLAPDNYESAAGPDVVFANDKAIVAFRGDPPSSHTVRHVRISEPIDLTAPQPASGIEFALVHDFVTGDIAPNMEGIPRMAACGSRVAAVWHGTTAQGEVAVHLSRNPDVTDAGSAWTAPVAIGPGSFPNIAVDCGSAAANDTWVVTWELNSLLHYAIGQGTPPIFGSAIHATQYTIDRLSDHGPRIAGRGSRWVAVWEENEKLSWAAATTVDLASSSFSASGVLDGPGQYDLQPDIETDGSTWTVVWKTSGQHDVGQDIAYTSTTQWSPRFAATSLVDLSVLAGGYTGMEFPSVAVDTAGRWSVAFESSSLSPGREIWHAEAEPLSTECALRQSACVSPPSSCATAACNHARAEIWRDFESCVQGKLASYYGGDQAWHSGLFSACREKLQLPDGVCNGCSPRFLLTDCGATITDNLTGLVWEAKRSEPNAVDAACPGAAGCDDAAKIHDSSHIYYWSDPAEPMDFVENGGAFVRFLRALNSSAFAGSSGWRLPTFAELVSTLTVPASSSATIDSQAHPELICLDNSFATADSNLFWSGTESAGISQSTSMRSDAWYLGYRNSSTTDLLAGKHGRAKHVRAVRGGF